MTLYKEEKGTQLFGDIMNGLEELKKRQAIEQALSSLSLPPSFLSGCGQCTCCEGEDEKDEFNFTFTQGEVDTLTAILGFFNPKEGDSVYTLQDKLSEASDEGVVEAMFDLVELVNEDGTSISAPLFGTEGYFLNKECMNLKFNK